MVITICDNCKAETSAYPPAHHKNHVPYCSACRDEYFKKQGPALRVAQALCGQSSCPRYKGSEPGVTTNNYKRRAG